VYLPRSANRQPSVTIEDPNAADSPILDLTPATGTITETVVAGTTIKSPAAYHVYSTVRILTAAAVTNDEGQVVCVTDSISGDDPSEFVTATFNISFTTVPYLTRTIVETLYTTESSRFHSPITVITNTNFGFYGPSFSPSLSTLQLMDGQLTPISIRISRRIQRMGPPVAQLELRFP
jgi:hypothetical protein